VVLVGFNRLGVKRLWPYLLVDVFLRLFVLKSGVHATLAGVVLKLTIRLGGSATSRGAEPPLLRLEHSLQPIVSALVLPIIGLANAGLSLAQMGVQAIADPLPLGIALGLVVGKPLGILAASALVIGLEVARTHPASPPIAGAAARDACLAT
jgi:NhaA family Na+:H+ antiporter